MLRALVSMTEVDPIAMLGSPVLWAEAIGCRCPLKRGADFYHGQSGSALRLLRMRGAVSTVTRY